MSSPAAAGPGFPPASSPLYLHGGPVGFGQALRQAFRYGFAYRGRASRPAYWWFVLFQAIFSVVLMMFLSVVSEVTGGAARVHGSVVGDTIGVTLFIAYLFFFYLTLVSLALLVRRLHDIGRSGWRVCICFVPLVGPFIVLFFTTLDGEPALNRYDQF